LGSGGKGYSGYQQAKSKWPEVEGRDFPRQRKGYYTVDMNMGYMFASAVKAWQDYPTSSPASLKRASTEPNVYTDNMTAGEEVLS
jgi:hypothetical protein